MSEPFEMSEKKLYLCHMCSHIDENENGCSRCYGIGNESVSDSSEIDKAVADFRSRLADQFECEGDEQENSSWVCDLFREETAKTMAKVAQQKYLISKYEATLKKQKKMLSKPMRLCACGCGTTDKKMKKSLCCSTRYVDETHQKNHWKQHKPVCVVVIHYNDKPVFKKPKNYAEEQAMWVCPVSCEGCEFCEYKPQFIL